MNKDNQTCVYVPYARLNGMQIPTRVQVAYARDYCKRNDLEFSLARDELFFNNSYTLFKNIINDNISEIILFSDILIANYIVSTYLTERIKKSNEIKNPLPNFHLTFSNEIVNIHQLNERIESIFIHKKFAMSMDQLVSYLNTN